MSRNLWMTPKGKIRMSVSRKLYSIRRLFKHKWCYFLVFAICFLSLVLTFGVWQGHIDEGHDHKHVGEVKLRRTYRETNELGENAQNVYEKTEFKDGVIGNYEPDPNSIIRRSGPGENGEGVNTDRGSQAVHRANNEFGFNVVASDMISLNRSIPDTRNPECKYWHYPKKLPSASVVVVFHNEAWTPLMRTVHSVLLRSPPELLKEVLLVDDFSVKDHLKSKLEEYIQQFQGKVRLIRTTDREGLIGARTTGAKNAKGDVVIFLDAHCEANVNWLPPLLAPIAENRKVMTVPVIDGIDMHTWHYRSQYGYGAGALYRGIFEWGLLYKETAIPEKEKQSRKYSSEPFRSPTHAGGLFAINRDWFENLGYYDPGLKIWGGEQYELSFKIWQCGGGILFVPCSKVGHVYRMRMPYTFGKLQGPIVSTNHKRVVEVWMDEYKEYYFIREPFMRHRDHGDISKQLEIREKNKCKSFKWFMENVAYDVESQYPLLPPNKVWGEAKNIGSNQCLDTMGQPVPAVLGVSGCHGLGGNQETKQIRHKDKGQCLSVEGGPGQYILHLSPCKDNDANQKWAWREIWL